MKRFDLFNTLRIILTIFVGIIFLLPLVWMVLGSFGQPGTAPPRSVVWLPDNPQWDNFKNLFLLLPFSDYIFNSVFIVALATPITLLMSSWAGFGMARSYDPWRHKLFILSIVLLMIPGAAIWLFRFQLFRWVNLVDTRWAIIVPAFAAGSPLFVLLYYWSFRQVPAQLWDSAEIEGAPLLRQWWSIGLPLVTPTTVAVTVLAAVFYWSDFVGPILYLRRPNLYTLSIGMQLVQALDSTNWPLLMAAATLMTVPVLLLFLLLQRFFLSELSLSNLR